MTQQSESRAEAPTGRPVPSHGEAGDHRDTPSVQGAPAAGRRFTDAVLEDPRA